MNRMSREEFERQAVLYSMGSLGPEEARRFEEERSRRGLEGERLEHGVRQAIDRASGPGGMGPSEREALARVTARPPRSGAPWGWIALSLVLALAAGGAAAWALSERAGAAGARDELRAAERAADSLATALAQARAAAASQPRAGDLAPLLAAPDLAIVPLTGPVAAGRILGAEGWGAVLVAYQLPPLQGEGTYQLWRRAGQVTEAVAPLGNAAEGYLFAIFSDAEFLAGAEAVVVTAEPAPGRAAPMEPPVLEGRL